MAQKHFNSFIREIIFMVTTYYNTWLSHFNHALLDVYELWIFKDDIWVEHNYFSILHMINTLC